MTWLYWVVVALTVYFVAQGLIKGATVAALGALAAGVAYVLAAMLLPAVGEMLVKSTLMPQDLTPEWRRAVGFTATFGLLYLVFMVLISIMPGAKRPSTPAQMLGVIAGGVKSLMVSMAIVGILLASPLSPALGQDVERSALLRFVAGFQQRYIQGVRSISPIPFPPVGPDSKF
jgi:uncharacterized membrane protein required for colicin V production